MAVRRMLAAVATAAATLLLTAAPAAAHGAPTAPLSRAAACEPQSRLASSPACRAAISAGAAVREWDNIRVAGINGRDRERIPDGELCSGGLSAYQGLNLPRVDWPATELAPGARFSFRYRTTIPHKGTFRLYASVDGYDPERRLTWADLEPLPFMTVTDPPLRDGAYQMSGRLPAGKTGRHLIYTIWQNSNTQDTYYSCSDVVFRVPGGSAGAAAPTPSARPETVRASPAPAASVRAAAPRAAATEAPPAGADGVPVASVTDLSDGSWPLVAGAAAAVTVLLATMVGVRLRKAGSVPVGRPCEVRNHRAGRRRIW